VALTPSLCRDCFTLSPGDGPACTQCGSRRIVRHAELLSLTIAHVDCDAFFASVEKRDRPELASRPVIVGGGKRGVVAAACYVARTYGIRSAMPMFKALAACPDAVVIKPDGAKYAAAGAQIRTNMEALSPLVHSRVGCQSRLGANSSRRTDNRSQEPQK
jgi:DNA polymerase-4